MKLLHERIIDAADRLAQTTLEMIEHVNRGEPPPEHLVEERHRIVAELIALDEERQRERSG
jgi:hypothetical protein